MTAKEKNHSLLTFSYLWKFGPTTLYTVSTTTFGILPLFLQFWCGSISKETKQKIF